MAARRRARPNRRRAHARGVTLLELMAVVTIIGIFVALGFPAMGGVLQDRQTARAAEEISNLFRIARSRAAATGAAHRVSAAATSPASGRFELRTALVNVGGPTSSCTTPVWTDTDSRVLQQVDLRTTGTGSLAARGIQIKPLTGVSSDLEYCFTPGGLSWVREGGALWRRPAGSQAMGWELYQVSGTTVVGLTRVVRVMPSGLPSIEAK